MQGYARALEHRVEQLERVSDRWADVHKNEVTERLRAMELLEANKRNGHNNML